MNLPRLFLRLLLGRRLPLTDGRLAVPGLTADVQIDRDTWGIPHIDATNDLDGYFGVGFCHGQDRSFQLELVLRAGRGTLAALFGPVALAVDRLSRRIGFHRSSQRQWSTLDADIRDMLEAYARGVNAGRKQGSPRAAHEFSLLRSAPTEWTALDSLGALNDIAVHGKIAGKLVGGRGRKRQRAFAVGLVSGREQLRVAPLRHAAVQAADHFRQARPFWS